ncbi:MAG: hypothetical protein FJ096_17155 [Deltaproteobacteria bacterium]|nr:hypothetical protein [Deltaproteobacteria bacterium]
MSPRRTARRIAGTLGAGLLLGALASGVGCGATATPSNVRALQATGPAAFVCVGPRTPTEGEESSTNVAAVALPLAACTGARTANPDVPHLLALTTQPLRGEIAVVDLTAESNPLIDADPVTPGTNFLPVGANPTDLVATPGGTAAFVGIAEPGHEGIFALPANQLRGVAPRLHDWPACALPERPGAIRLLLDEADAGGAVRPRCDAAYGDADLDATCGPNDEAHCHGDLALDAESVAAPGRYKLLVSLPTSGGVAVIDAQAILDQERGAYEPCRIERFLPLEVALATDDTPPPTVEEACVAPKPATPKATAVSARPAGLAVTDRAGGGYRVYVADKDAPTIHRLDFPSACDPIEIAPLLATSIEDPTRVVTTNRLAVSPLTYDLRRYLYAIDEIDGSLMVFDVSDDATSRRPLTRPTPERNPFQPPDRIRFGSPPRDLVLLERRADASDDETGAALPVKCDPSPAASTDAASYRTAADFSSGAGPRKLRGVFGLAVLASGNVVTIDVDDLDAACRGPKTHDPLFGCADQTSGLEGASTEYTCGVVAPHQPRAGTYLAFRENVTATQPGVQALPLLFDVDGTILEANDEGAPRMRATIPDEPIAFDFILPVGPSSETVASATGLLVSEEPESAGAHVLVMNGDDPRAHILAQSWAVTYEGSIPGFAGHFASLTPVPGGFELRDPAVGFCSTGVLGRSAVAAELVATEGLEPAAADLAAGDLADYVQVTSETPVLTDTYWNSQSECTFTACQQTYGTLQNPLEARDLRIEVAKEDVLLVSPRGDLPSPGLKCCFPNLVQFRVRGGDQWVVTGTQVGFLHHGAADEQGVCRPRCDARLSRLNGRVRMVEGDDPVKDGHPRAFVNPFFRFAIRGGAATARDMRFEFTTQGQFAPLQVALLGSGGSTDVQPTAATYLPTTGEVVVSDGALQGLTLLRLDSLSVSRQYQ